MSGLEVVVEAGAEETSLSVTAAGKERDRSEEAEPAEEGEQTIREEEETRISGMKERRPRRMTKRRNLGSLRVSWRDSSSRGAPASCLEVSRAGEAVGREE